MEIEEYGGAKPAGCFDQARLAQNQHALSVSSLLRRPGAWPPLAPEPRVPSGVLWAALGAISVAGVGQEAQLGVGEFRSVISATKLRVQFRNHPKISLAFLDLLPSSVSGVREWFGINFGIGVATEKNSQLSSSYATEPRTVNH